MAVITNVRLPVTSYDDQQDRVNLRRRRELTYEFTVQCTYLDARFR